MKLMNDNIITIGTGSITSMTVSIVNNIVFVEIWEVAVYGFIGAIAGYLAKVLVKYIISLIKKTHHE